MSEQDAQGRIVGRIRPAWRGGPRYELEADRPSGRVVDPVPADDLEYAVTISSPAVWIDYLAALGLPGPLT